MPIEQTHSREDQPITIMWLNMEVPVLPLDSVSIHLEAYAFRLNNMQRLNVLAHLEAAFPLSEQIGKIVEFSLSWRNALSAGFQGGITLKVSVWMRSRGKFVCAWGSMRREVDVYHLVGIGVYYGEEIQRVCIEVLMFAESSIHQASTRNSWSNIFSETEDMNESYC